MMYTVVLHVEISRLAKLAFEKKSKIELIALQNTTLGDFE